MLVGIRSKIVATQDKVAFITANPRYERSWYVTHERQWIRTPDGALHSNPEFLGKGSGWAEMTDAGGDLWRWRVPQDGMCPRCWLRDCPGRCAAGTLLPALRNETQRRLLVARAAEKVTA